MVKLEWDGWGVGREGSEVAGNAVEEQGDARERFLQTERWDWRYLMSHMEQELPTSLLCTRDLSVMPVAVMKNQPFVRGHLMSRLRTAQAWGDTISVQDSCYASEMYVAVATVETALLEKGGEEEEVTNAVHRPV